MNPQNIQTVQVKVTGMSCNGCVRAVENALTRTAGVISSKVSLEEGRAEVQY
ncbi:MAG: heavy-metal-associated domain-containing protein, partial [Calditrichaeota bacterium]